jgi:hypothetical protein
MPDTNGVRPSSASVRHGSPMPRDDQEFPAQQTVNVEVITLGDVRSDVKSLGKDVQALTGMVGQHMTRVETRLDSFEDGVKDQETRIRVIERSGATRADVDGLRATIDARAEARRGQLPGWASVGVAAFGLMITVCLGVVSTMLLMRGH